MITRWLPLFLRARGVPLTASLSLAAVVAVTLLWATATDRSEVDPSLAALTVMLALTPLISTLGSADAALEKSAAMPWPPRRALHLTGAGAFVAVLLLAPEVAGVDFGPAGQIIRNSAGLTGLIGLGVALLGTRLAWVAPIVWPAVQLMTAVPGGPAWQQALAWLIQPVDSIPAALTAAGLLLAGALAYAARVGPPTAPTEIDMAP